MLHMPPVTHFLYSSMRNYVKRIGGMIMVETQAGSYNLETIRIFVAYAHSYFFIEVGAGVAIDFEKVGLDQWNFCTKIHFSIIIRKPPI